ncbi:hypothetical protein [Candidatus Manganitrophus noduliformans]|uniref:Uncharacterized protein n=1 Tax=Candidatus Manganitrophus noduliformans TaxID=2606439 RepID=A0A7X6ID98_9BACT|nr:hypothetical protein [Candidatus Manganitrophus noduliformans]NKE73508.1 hypothetical protein [Candidatus Manganitrophus noduliformans]
MPKEDERPGNNAPSLTNRLERPIKHPEEVDFRGRTREWWRKRAGKWRERKNKAAQQLARAGERLNTIPMNPSLRAREREKREILREMETYKGQVREGSGC